METVSRSLLKALTWRIIAVIITTSIAFFITKKVAFAITIGMIDMVVKIVVYYAHERVWNRLDFGRKIPGRVRSEE